MNSEKLRGLSISELIEKSGTIRIKCEEPALNQDGLYHWSVMLFSDDIELIIEVSGKSLNRDYAHSTYSGVIQLFREFIDNA